MKKNDISRKTLAKIGKGTKRKRRETNDLEIAEEMDFLYRKHKSFTKVASLVKLSPEMVRQIRSLSTLENKVKQLYWKGILKGYDVGYRISKLQKKDQSVLAKHITDNKLISEDVRSIVKYKIDNPNMPIEKVIDKVIKSKDRKIYVAYLAIEKDTFEKLLVEIRNKDKEKVVKSIVHRVVPSANLKLNGRVVILKVLKEGLPQIKTAAKKLKIPLAKLADALVREYLDRNK